MKLLDIFKRKKVSRRQYAGANVGRLFADFNSSDKSADAEIRFALKTLRNRCRDLERNNEYARRYIHLLKTNVVGEKGVNMQVKARNSDGTFDRIGNVQIEREWAAWGKMGNCTVDGKMSWSDAQKFFMQSLARDGEVLIRKVSYPNKWGFAIEFLEPDVLDELKNEVLPNGNQIRMGVEIDKFYKPVAYYILTYHPGDVQFSPVARRHVRVPADKIIHAFIGERAQQTRGVPMMSTAITSLKMLHGYREAELVAARVGASKMGFFTSATGNDFPADDTENTYTPIMSAEPGTFHQLPEGMDFKPFDPTHPTTAFADFEKAVLRGIASGLGVSYTSLANDLEGVSYSSIRQGSLEDRDFYKTLQMFMIQHFVEPVYREWLSMAMTTTALSLPITKFDKFADSTEFRARGFAWVDPQKEINAAVTAINNGIMSMQDVANQYGRDVEETFEQVAMETELAKEYGVNLAFQPFGQKMQAAPIITGAEDAPEERSISLNLKMENDTHVSRNEIKLIRDKDGMVLGAESVSAEGRKVINIVRDKDGKILGAEQARKEA
jgi:lambda family phage portal protein